MKPIWDEFNEEIDWEGKAYSPLTFYAVHMCTLNLIHMIEHYPRMPREGRAELIPLILETADALEELVCGFSYQVECGAHQVSAALRCFFRTGLKEEELKAKYHLMKVRTLLGLDELFGREDAKKPFQEEHHNPC